MENGEIDFYLWRIGEQVFKEKGEMDFYFLRTGERPLIKISWEQYTCLVQYCCLKYKYICVYERINSNGHKCFLLVNNLIIRLFSGNPLNDIL